MKRETQVKFRPDRGLEVGQTIKEQVQTLLAEGYFDEAESAIVGVSNRGAYDLRWAGDKFDCMALTTALVGRLTRE